MAVQLPSEAIGAAAGVLAYSVLCLGCGLFLLWLVWAHNERKSYVAMLAFFASLATVASIAQQIHTIVWWRDVKTAEWENIVANVGNPELNITGGATGVDLVLFYIQYYSYNVESMLVFFWSVELANSIFQMRMIQTYRFHASFAAKILAAILPALQMVLLRFSGVTRSTPAFMVVADVIMVLCFAAGSITLFFILALYLRSRFTLSSWHVPYGDPSAGTAASTPRLLLAPKTSIYDKWLVVRFTIAFLALSLFEIVVVNFQLRAAGTNNPANLRSEPDLSAGRATGDFVLFIPGVSAAVLVFLVFGTTKTFREYLWTLFVPASLRRRHEARQNRRKETQASVSAGSGLGESARRGPDPVRDVETSDRVLTVEASGRVVMVQMQDFGKTDGDGDGKSDEWPIMKPESPAPPWSGPTGLSPPPWRR